MVDDLHIWRCKNGHGLGIIQRNVNGINRLLLYRNAIDLEEMNPQVVDVIAVIESAVDIKCDICESTRTWAPNQAAFDRLMSRFTVTDMREKSQVNSIA